MKMETGLKKLRRSRVDFVIILQTSSLQKAFKTAKGNSC